MFKDREYYKELIKPKHDYKVMLKNFLQAFIFGGLVSIIGQLFFDLYNKVLNQDEVLAQTYMTLTIVTITAILTAFGIYDNIGQIGKCGLSIPISGEASRGVTQKVIPKGIKRRKKVLKNDINAGEILKKSKYFYDYMKNWEKILRKEDEYSHGDKMYYTGSFY